MPKNSKSVNKERSTEKKTRKELWNKKENNERRKAQGKIKWWERKQYICTEKYWI